MAHPRQARRAAPPRAARRRTLTRPAAPRHPARRPRPRPAAAAAAPPPAPDPSAAGAASCRPPRLPCPASTPGWRARPPAAPAAPAPAAADTPASAARCRDAAAPARLPAPPPGPAAAARSRAPALAAPAAPADTSAAATRPAPRPRPPAPAGRPAPPARTPPPATPRAPRAGPASRDAGRWLLWRWFQSRSWRTSLLRYHTRLPQPRQLRVQRRRARGRYRLRLVRFGGDGRLAGDDHRRPHRLGERGRRRPRRPAQRHVLTLPARVVEDDALPLGVQAEALPAHLPGHVERRPRQAFPRQLQRVGLHPPLQRPPHLLRGPEVAVRRHQPVDPLVRPLEVVMIDPVAQPPAGIGQVHEHRRLQALPPQRAPEALDLAQGLRVPRRRHHLADAALVQLPGEGAGAPPGHVLRAVVGQDLLGRPEGVQRGPQGFEDQGGGL